jgi:uncharacterized protein
VATVRWLSWTTDAFARARAENKPVLLSIVAPWCASCHAMDRTTYADPAVAACVNDRLVPVRVDADRRPDISDRYSLGGWPTTAFLTADGDVITGGTYVPADRMASVLERVLSAFDSRRLQLLAPPHAERSARPQAATADRAPESADLLSLVFSTFDELHGGFGIEPKFPLTPPLELAIVSHRTSRDGHLAHVVEATLDAIGWGELHDDVDGGFFRCAATRDWRAPAREKLLDVNAALLRSYLEASDALGIARYRERATEILRYVQTWLADSVDGGWAGSQAADDVYYTSPADVRRTLPPPGVDAAFYAGSNASMASSMLYASHALDDPALGVFALKSLERVLLGCYSPGAGVAHYLDGAASVRGLLDDQIRMATAQLDAHEATGNIVYEMMAQELAHYAVRTMWDEADGGFFDRSLVDDEERVGLMNERLKPFAGNCDAARLLKRLAAVTGDRSFEDKAEATLAAMAPLAAGQGPLAAHYLLARQVIDFSAE